MKNDSCFNPLDRECVLMSESELLEATTDVSYGCIVVASSLSNLLVVKCLKHQARAILTKQCNLASHAANILRAANSNGQIIDWVYGVDIDQISKYIGMSVYFDGERVVHRKRLMMAPGEMEEVKLKKEQLVKYPDLTKITVKVEAE